ncbi:proline--tRNA ligase [Enterococcus florum]|uniref:Proline--tRNA ligase n=1 Tax=Enterococcus florum TaxID=2480627 RepID=A0A4P5P5K4_9ENTE|nr:YbaK/EbsC family protein [Enterococcus florum]GCF92970.1 proline--tRNA ligase [Enterococcus florum]
MSLQKVKEYFAQYGMAERIIVFDVSSATVELAAQALGCAPERIAKTLSFQLKKADKTILIVAAGDAKVDNTKFKQTFHERALMLKVDTVVEKVGHPIGGVCPFAIPSDVLVYLDESLKRFETVFPACGDSNSAIELTIPELETYANTQHWVDVCNNWA